MGINWWGIGSQYQDNPALGWLIATFLIFVGIVVHYVKKPLAVYLKDRVQEAQTQTAQALKLKESAYDKLKACQARLAKLPEETASIKEEFRKQGQYEKAELEKKAKSQAQKISQATKSAMALQRSQADFKLKEQIAAEIVFLLTQKTQQEKSVIIERNLMNQFLHDIPSSQSSL